MGAYLDTRGERVLSVGICARCGLKFPLANLRSDPNFPGLMVCDDDIDDFDPYRLAPRATERVNVDNPRPDVSVSFAGPTVWQAGTAYAQGQTIVPNNPDSDAVQLPVWQFTCTVAGTSGAAAPAWTDHVGTRVTDGTVTWINSGIWLM